MGRVRADLERRSPATRSVVLAHAFVAGAEPSDSERDISVGGVARVPTEVFDGVDYAALGHLHGRHTLTETIRYSGSPLAYSFSEAGHRKGAWLVELGARGLVSAEFVDAPVPRPLARLRGTLEELLADPTLAQHEDSWVEATLTDQVRPVQAMDRLRARFPHALLLGFDSGPAVSGLAPVVPTATRSDHDIAREFVTDMRGVPPTDAETALLHAAVDACCEDTDVDTLLSEEASA
jgi:exonuclease SbcD